MRAFIILVAAALTACAANAADWVSVCYGQDAQYMQTIGGPGYFHIGNGDGTYDTQKLTQAYYDGNIVCGTADPKAPVGSNHVGMVCADKSRKVISVMYLEQMKQKHSPKDAPAYCNARVSVH
ncbi:MAG: hypothetical protein KGJ78_17525 [Alphaproteobacteria bacterium]|nr:hypothetical protein [Alphaproteobacteria bacterium]